MDTILRVLRTDDPLGVSCESAIRHAGLGVPATCVRSKVFEQFAMLWLRICMVRAGLSYQDVSSTAYVYGSEISGAVLGRPDGINVRSLLQLQRIMVFLSPYVLRLLRHGKSSLRSRLSPSVRRLSATYCHLGSIKHARRNR